MIKKIAGRRHALACGALLFALAGCGDKEPEQRKAFIGFLQTRVLDKPGLHVPQLTEDERIAFGPYTEQWAVITRFHKVMDASVAPKMNEALSKSSFASLGDVMEKRDVVRRLVTVMDEMGATLKGDIAETDTAYRNLQQPDDLKATFSRAYARLVSEPAAAFAAVVPVFDEAMAATLKLADYVDASKGRVKIAGSTLQVTDTRLQTEINAMIRDIQARRAGMVAAQTRVQTLVFGANP